MKLHFLVGDSPLTKTFTLQEDGTYKKTPYPNAFNVSSIEHDANTPAELYALLLAHAGHGHCLLKGELRRQITNESRAGLVPNDTLTEWVVFDIDGLEGIESPSHFVTEILPPEFQDVSYIVQHSASSGISGKGMRAHIFFMLESPVSPDDIKRWFTFTNLKEPLLSKQIGLSKNSLTAKFGLDRTVAENGKLIFIAPPVCSGFDDPLAGERISLVELQNDKVDYMFPCPGRNSLDSLLEARINELREESGMKPDKGTFTNRGDYRILLNPGEMKITGEREQNGFMRVNINDGDSWAYWYNPRAPEYLHNFKGEPSVPLAKADAEYYAEKIQPTQDKKEEGFAVYRDKITDAHFHIEWDTDTGSITDHYPIKKQNIRSLCEYSGRVCPDPIPTFLRTFDPTDDRTVDLSNDFINLYEPSEYQRKAGLANEVPPIIKKVMFHACGDDQEVFEWALNWLAYIYQTRKKSMVAVVLHGVEGTGKGLLFNNIIAPIFGEKYCLTKKMSELTDRFNSDLEQALFVNFDEARLKDLGNESSRINNELKMLIVAPRIAVRGMRENSRQINNYTNIMLTANQRDILPEMERTERRLTVAPRQETPIQITKEEIEGIEAELLQFASFLAAHEAVEAKATRPLANEAKEIMYQDNLTSVQEFAQALIEGNLMYFMDMYQTRQDVGDIDYDQPLLKDTVNRWYAMTDAELTFVPTSELLIAYRAMSGTKISPKKFGKLLQHNNLSKSVVGRVPGGSSTRGRHISWKFSAEEKFAASQILGQPAPKNSEGVVEGAFNESIGTAGTGPDSVH